MTAGSHQGGGWVEDFKSKKYLRAVLRVEKRGETDGSTRYREGCISVCLPGL
ncbi:Unknown protein sequence [Pseudomonas syringae pv. cilantro]|uniref:Uncharacterized protein n=1 Tax=Pseudomonas syringae pv. cilantro TaxID=81035 RepID=A0A0N0X8H4_PSESX|nr:Unknown protein sequence [Pseudomonas syringae pv. cilantro]